MIENAVASTLMRLPMSELSALRQIFLSSPGGLSMEAFVAAMLPRNTTRPPPPACEGSSSFRVSSTKISRPRETPSSGSEPRGNDPSADQNPNEPPLVGGQSNTESFTAPSINSKIKKEKEKKKIRGSVSGRSRSQAPTAPFGGEIMGRVKLSKREGGERKKGVEGLAGTSSWSASRAVKAAATRQHFLSEEQKVAIIADLIELFRQVDHNGDKVMEWEEFTGFVIDQVLALTKGSPRVESLKLRPQGSRGKPSLSSATRRYTIRRVRYDRQLGSILACVGSVVHVLDPFAKPKPWGASEEIQDSGTYSYKQRKRPRGFVAHASEEETQGFEIGSSAALPREEVRKRPLHDIDPSKRRDGVSAMVLAVDVKFIKRHRLLMVLRSDLSLAFFAEDTFFRAGIFKTASQQYVLEYCEEAGLAFTSGFDGSIHYFAIDAHHDTDRQNLVATATYAGDLRRHTDVVQDLIAVNGTEAQGGAHVISCGLDRGVYVWNIAKGAFVQSKHGNGASIRSLAFDPGDSLLFGAGVEGEILAWDLWEKLASPLFRLQGHRSPILRVACAAGKGRAASLDENGKIMLWDTRKHAYVDVSQRYLCHVDCRDNRPPWLDLVSDDGDGCRLRSRWSHIGVSVVTAGHQPRIYDAIDSRASEPPLAAALYSPNCVSFLTCNGPFVTLWDACTGKSVKTAKAIDAVDADIVRACLDGGQRRLILASSTGEIVIYGYLQGMISQTLRPGHVGPVSGLAYVPEDKVIVTGGWDRSLRVYDEIPIDGDPTLLRKVDGAHSSDINVVSVSHRLSLIASGSAGGTCRVWDFQFLSLEGTYAVGDEVLCLCFLEPYPLLAVGDSGGYISIIPLRPWLGRVSINSILLRFANDQEAVGTIEGPPAVTCITSRATGLAGSNACSGEVIRPRFGSTFNPPDVIDARASVTAGQGGGRTHGLCTTEPKETSRRVCSIYSGDDQGTVRVWDVGDLLLSIGCSTIPEDKLPRSKGNYDARRRFYRQTNSLVSADPKEARSAGSGIRLRAAPGRLQDSDENGWKTTKSATRYHAELRGDSPPHASIGAHTLTQGGAVGLGAHRANGNHHTLQRESNGEGATLESRAARDGARTDRIMSEGAGVSKTESRNQKEGMEFEVKETGWRGSAAAKGLALVGLWTPHSEAVVSLEVIEDPLCLLTASRDRSVKVRALPESESGKTNDFGDTTYGDFLVNPEENEISAATVTVEASVIGHETGNGGESSNEPLPPTVSRTKQTHLGHTTTTESADQTEAKEPVKPADSTESQKPLHATDRGATASSLLDSSVLTSLESSPLSSSSGKLPPPYGYDLAVLTLGRIEDGFRRDAFVFPVDLKGRGQGRAAEARAVLQALDEIDRRKESKRKDEAEVLIRAQGTAVAAVAAADMTRVLPLSPSSSPSPLIPTTTPMVSPTQLGENLPALPPSAGEDYEYSLTRRKTQQEYVDAPAAELTLPSRNLPINVGLIGTRPSQDGVPSQDAQNSEAHNLQIADADEVIFSDPATAYKGLYSKTITVGRTSGKVRTHVAVSGPVLKKSFSTSTLKVMAPSGTKRAGHRDSKGSLYENMKAEVLRLKKLDTSTIVDVRGASNMMKIRKLLEPTPFLLSKMPDVLWSYQPINAIVPNLNDKARPRMRKHNNNLWLQTSDTNRDGRFRGTGENEDRESLGARAKPMGQARGGATEFSSSQSKESSPPRVITRRTLRKSLPQYLSASPGSFGAASRWGELSKAHLEFHRLKTAGILSMSCPSLWKNASGKAGSALRKGSADIRYCPDGAMEPQKISLNVAPPLLPVEVADIARRKERAQARWKRRIEDFAIAFDASDRQNETKPRLQKIRQRRCDIERDLVKPRGRGKRPLLKECGGGIENANEAAGRKEDQRLQQRQQQQQQEQRGNAAEKKAGTENAIEGETRCTTSLGTTRKVGVDILEAGHF